jgi:hypothetical protein
LAAAIQETFVATVTARPVSAMAVQLAALVKKKDSLLQQEGYDGTIE